MKPHPAPWYDETLDRDLRQFDEHRVSTLLLFTAIAFGLAYSLYWAISSDELYRNPTKAYMFLMSAFTVGAIAIWAKWRHFTRHFKAGVIPLVLHAVAPSLQYDPTHEVDTESFRRSRLFPERQPLDFDSEDAVWGTIDDTAFSFCEVLATRGAGETRVTVFKGLFFDATVKASLPGRVVVIPAQNQGMWGKVQATLSGDDYQRDQQIQIGDADFDAAFDIFTDRPDVARKFLSPARRSRIYAICREAGQPVYVSFVKDKVFLALPLGVTENIFEPRLFRRLANRALIGEYVKVIRMAENIIKTLAPAPRKADAEH